MSTAPDFTATIRRKTPSLPRYIEVPASRAAPLGLSGTTPVEVSLNGIAIGRRNLKRWGHGREGWFLELPERLCRKAGVDTGDEIALALRLATRELPAEVSTLIESNPAARRRWDALTDSQRRMLGEQVRDAKRPSTRNRRARRALCPET